MLDLLQIIATAIGTLAIAGGSLVGLAWLTFKLLGEKWLENKFARQLEKFKHEQQIEIEQMRYRISSLFDRAVRLHQAEFEVVPETWARMMNAHSYAEFFLSPGRMVPDFANMSDAHMREFFESSRLHNFEKEELKQTSKSEMGRYYTRTLFWHELGDAKKAHTEFRDYLTKRACSCDLT